MYIGRIVAIGMSQSGKTAAMYRVSSRSFPNRQAKQSQETIAIIPKAGFENDITKNPYIAYNCTRITGDYAVVANGSHTDPLTEKLATGMSPRDALSLTLLAMDYEKDALDTPRIAAIIKHNCPLGWLGIVRKDAIMVREFELSPQTAYYVATYEKNMPTTHNIDKAFDIESAEDACCYIIGKGVFSDFEKPVTAACAVSNGSTFKLATLEA